MTNNIKLFATASGVAIAILGATPAFASGTVAGFDIVNQATVSYQVGGNIQTPVIATDTLRVDRKVTVAVVELGSATTTVSPGQAQAATAFTVSNTSNAAIDIALAATNFGAVAAPHGGTDGFNPGAYTFYVETGGVAGFDATDTLVTYLDSVPADGTRTVYVVTSIPLTDGATAITNGLIAAVHLTGTASELNASSTAPGAAITATAGANDKLQMDTVLLDAAGTASGDVANDGKASDDDDYTVAAAVLTVAKFSRVLADPVNVLVSGALDNVNAVPNPNAKAIPGATIEYCITVANTAGATIPDATNVAISDSLASLPVTYLAAFGVRTGATVASGVCTTPTGTGSFASNTVSGTLGTIPQGTLKTLYFRATIN